MYLVKPPCPKVRNARKWNGASIALRVGCRAQSFTIDGDPVVCQRAFSSSAAASFLFQLVAITTSDFARPSQDGVTRYDEWGSGQFACSACRSIRSSGRHSLFQHLLVDGLDILGFRVCHLLPMHLPMYVLLPEGQ
jgi:hypothetical protein